MVFECDKKRKRKRNSNRFTQVNGWTDESYARDLARDERHKIYYQYHVNSVDCEEVGGLKVGSPISWKVIQLTRKLESAVGCIVASRT